MAADPVDAIISGKVTSVEQLGQLAPSVVKWLKHSLPLAHKDKALKRKIKRLFGVARFTSNLAYFELWGDLLQECGSKALELGQDMQHCFVESDLGIKLGEAIPNTFAKVQMGKGVSSNCFVTTPCSKENGVRRQVWTLQ
jgi:hypothetical protein